MPFVPKKTHSLPEKNKKQYNKSCTMSGFVYLWEYKNTETKDEDTIMVVSLKDWSYSTVSVRSDNTSDSIIPINTMTKCFRFFVDSVFTLNSNSAYFIKPSINSEGKHITTIYVVVIKSPAIKITTKALPKSNHGELFKRFTMKIYIENTKDKKKYYKITYRGFILKENFFSILPK